MFSREVIIRLLSIMMLLILSIIVAVYSIQYSQLFASLFESVISLFYDRFDFYQLEIIKNQSEWGYQLLANNTTAILIGQTTLPPNLGITAFTLSAHSIQHVLFFNLILLGSLIYYRLNYIRIFILMPLAIVFLELIDIPMVLIGSIEDLLLFQFDSQHYETSLKIIWMNFLNNGGRIGLAMIAGWIVVITSQTSNN